MYLYEIAYDSFLLMQSDWQVDKAQQLLELKHLKTSHVIIQKGESQQRYYLFKSSEVLKQLSTVTDQTLQNALKLDEITETPVLDAYSDAEKSPGFCIVTDEGRLISFYDISIKPYESRKHGNDDSTSHPDEPTMTRFLGAEFKEQVALHETVSLLVSLSLESTTDGEVSVDLPQGSTVEVVVSPKSHFKVQGKDEDQLKVLDNGKSMLQFKLRATRLGLGKIQISAFCDGQGIGELTLAATVVEEVTENTRTKQEKRLEKMSTTPPDLSLVILENQREGQTKITFHLLAHSSTLGLNFKSYDSPIQLNQPFQYFQDFYMEIENPQEVDIAEYRLGTKGTKLFKEFFPEELQTLLWENKERIQFVEIQSDEPWIHWELCKLYGKDSTTGRFKDGPFFCEAFAVTRWKRGLKMKDSITLKNLALVVSNSNLPNARAEREYMLSLEQKDKRKVTSIPAKFFNVLNALGSGQYDAWHFTGHGLFETSDPDHSHIVLDKDKLRVDDLMSGPIYNFGNIHHPLVFLNACQAGRSALSLTGIGGWAEQCLQIGAGAFISSYWKISDGPANKFARAFYDRLLGGMPIGKAVQGARLEIKATGDPTWLAYTVYANSRAVLAE